MKNLRKIFNIFLVAMMAGVFGACSMIDDPVADCDPHYKVRFRFDMNMLYANAFSTQVSEVALYVFNPAGELVWSGSESGSALASEDYLMDLPIPPGTYDFVAWCGKQRPQARGFIMDGGSAPKNKEHLRMTLERERDELTAHSSTDLHALFHGKLSAVEMPTSEGVHIITIPLIKDTNSIRIMLVHLDGSPISKDDFDFKITDENGRIDHDNSLMADEQIEYRAWAKAEGVAQTVPPIATKAPMTPGVTGLATKAPLTAVHSVVAELTTSRLQTCREPMLTVTRKSDGEQVIRIPLIDYFLMVKGEYNRHMDNDEFLDRQDDYSMTFFMYEDGTWYRQVLDILSWRVVLQSSDL